MTEYDDENKLLLKANELMLQAKGFMLITVDQAGTLNFACDTTGLSNAEIWGIHAYRKSEELDSLTDDDFDESDSD